MDMKVQEHVVCAGNARFTILTDGLLRLEYSPSSQFFDYPSHMVVHREFPTAVFHTQQVSGQLRIETDRLVLLYEGKEFSASSLSIELKGNLTEYCNVWHYGEPIANFGGTARTLDGCDGACQLEDGIFSPHGYSVIEDTSLYVDSEEHLHPRETGAIDMYYFGFGTDFIEGLHTFYQLCGFPPLLPRFALGNWWSRFYPYSDKEYLALMNRFSDEQVPISIAVLDMDWHKVDIDKEHGSGWTGYSWNKDLFPDPKQFLKSLHEHGVKVALNDHPSAGVRSYEDEYDKFAEAMQQDSKQGSPIAFDPSSPVYMEEFQKHILDPLEEDGVDFWWIDWQQGKISRSSGLDPLWVLNQTRYQANQDTNTRALILSRYAGIGSHRFPVGFSGDTIISWKSLEFQPYFTLSASHIGFGWWSHDIGGHMKGIKDEELHIRWVQLGVFSPIMRLHSSSNMFSGKEPWNFGIEAHTIINSFLRLRHSLLPYVYSMNHIAHAEGLPLVRPLYYMYPNDKESYEVKNEYFFGSSLIVSPIVKKCSELVQMSHSDSWIPSGMFYDFFTGLRYIGASRMSLFRTLDTIPVLVPAGAVIVQSEEFDANSNPKTLLISCFAGADGIFTLYEDDNMSHEYQDGAYTEVEFTFSWGKSQLHIAPVERSPFLPEMRSYTIRLFGVFEGNATLMCQGKINPVSLTYDEKRHCLQLVSQQVPIDEEISVMFDDLVQIRQNDKKREIFEILNRSQISFDVKEELYQLICTDTAPSSIIYEMIRAHLNNELVLAVGEILCSDMPLSD
jgi:alpha-glucosidase (family GH31 glycosyl hydrolase)